MSPQIQTANLASLPIARELGKITLQIADFGTKRAMQVTVHPGGSWSNDLKPHDGTDSCQKAHFGVVRSGTLAVRMDDGQEVHMKEGDVFSVPPGHDAWCVGDEAVVFLEFSREGV